MDLTHQEIGLATRDGKGARGLSVLVLMLKLVSANPCSLHP